MVDSAAIPEDEKSELKSSPQKGEHEWEWNNYDAFDYGKSRRYRHHPEDHRQG
jgi:hypothetical protein